MISRVAKIAVDITRGAIQTKDQEDLKGPKPPGRSDSDMLEIVTEFAMQNFNDADRSEDNEDQKDLKTYERITMDESERLGISFKDAEFWQAFTDFYDHPWFEGIWTLQHILPAREVTLLCGSHSVSWDLVKNAATWYQYKAGAIRDQFHCEINGILLAVDINLDWSTRTGPDFYPELFGMRTWPKYVWCFPRLLEQYCQRSTLDDRDRIYALVGISDLGLGGREDQAKVEIDYSKCVQEVYSEATTAIICHGSATYEGELDIILNARWRNNEKGWPSWVPDLRIETEHGCGFDVGHMLPRVQEYKKIRRHRYVKPGDVHSLIVQGVIIGKATYVSPYSHAHEMISDSNLRISRDIVLNLLSCYPTGEDVSFVYAMTLMAGKIPDAILDCETTPEVYAESFIGWIDACHMPVGSRKQRKQRREATKIYTDRGFDNNWSIELTKRYCGRRLYATNTGYMGLGNHYMMEGDVIALIVGLSNPCVLRPLSDKIEYGYAFVG
jgi:hypothetical protein